jgi:hypothetical protein
VAKATLFFYVRFNALKRYALTHESAISPGRAHAHSARVWVRVRGARMGAGAAPAYPRKWELRGTAFCQEVGAGAVPLFWDNGSCALY